MIEIDDALWGCSIGGVLIGGWRRETGEFVVDQVPVEFFQGESFRSKRYLESARLATQRVLEQLNHKPDEPICVWLARAPAHLVLVSARLRCGAVLHRAAEMRDPLSCRAM